MALEFQLRSIREGIKRFMLCGFYFSYTMDLTSNAKRREAMFEALNEEEKPLANYLVSLDKRYMWNFSLY
jgi:galactose-1-phosphate uridylyltransferase